MKRNESWYEKDWILALFIGIVGPLFIFTVCIIGWSIWGLKMVREIVWIEYKCFLILIGEISFDEFYNFFHKRNEL